jgi:hypothetical protein
VSPALFPTQWGNCHVARSSHRDQSQWDLSSETIWFQTFLPKMLSSCDANTLMRQCILLDMYQRQLSQRSESSLSLPSIMLVYNVQLDAWIEIVKVAWNTLSFWSGSSQAWSRRWKIIQWIESDQRFSQINQWMSHRMIRTIPKRPKSPERRALSDSHLQVVLVDRSGTGVWRMQNLFEHHISDCSTILAIRGYRWDLEKEIGSTALSCDEFECWVETTIPLSSYRGIEWFRRCLFWKIRGNSPVEDEHSSRSQSFERRTGGNRVMNDEHVTFCWNLNLKPFQNHPFPIDGQVLVCIDEVTTSEWRKFLSV